MRHPRLAALVVLCALALAAISRAQEPPPPGTTESREELPLPGGAPEILGCKSKVCFLLDRSGSMMVAGRFEKALDILEQLLMEMPASAQFDVYLVDDATVSLFKNEWYHALPDMRKSIRRRIDEAGGVACGGFTDLVGAVKLAADRRRPNAVYLLTDGVETVGDLETERVVAAIAKAAGSVKVPVHTIGIALGAHPAEDLREATSALRGIADATGGVFRPVKTAIGPEERPRGRALVVRPAWMRPPNEDLVRFHVYPAGEGTDLRPVKLTFGHERPIEIFSRMLFSSPLNVIGNKARPTPMGLDLPRSTPDPDERMASANDVAVEVEDPALRAGHVVFEYSTLTLGVRSFLPAGKLFSETRPGAIPLKRGRASATLAGAVRLRFVSLQDPWPGPEIQATGRDIDPAVADANGVVRVRVPSGGSVEFVYTRGGEEFRESAAVSPPSTAPDSNAGQTRPGRQ